MAIRCPRPAAHPTLCRRFTRLLLCLSLLSLPYAVRAQVLIEESFKNTTSAAFTLRDDAVLTATAGDAVGEGYLRLTANAPNQRGSVISNAAFPAANGFTISFEFFAYADLTGGADGFSLFLIDGSTSVADFKTGAYGSSLGYAPATVNGTTTAGATNGYLGIGLDEYGGFNSNSEGKSGGGLLPVRNSVALRGNAASNYPLLTPPLLASNTGSPLGVATTRAQAGAADYRRATINVTPTGGTFRITVRLQNGAGVVTALNSFLLTTPPPTTLRLGMAASTGSFKNTHEIRNLYVVVPPAAVDDNAVTPNNTAVTIPILSNDTPATSSFDFTTIDLDPNTIAIDRSVTVNGGTFTVDPATGTVTFRPSGLLSVGAFTVPYVVSTVATTGLNGVPATATNPATITVQVGNTGADIAASLLGPATVLPRSSITYVLTTASIGTASASTVVSKLTLDPALTLTSQLPTGATYAGGVLTFPVAPALAATTNAVYTATFTAPDNAMAVTAVASASTNSFDPNTNNNNGTATTSRVTTDVSRPLPGPLPVRLIKFDARTLNATPHLAWRTASEVNNAYFVVERSVDGTHFEPLAQLGGQGSSQQEVNYAYLDQGAQALAAPVLYYRLRQVDLDGTASLSPVRVVKWQVAPLQELRCYPNPGHGRLSLDLTEWPATACRLELLDLTGRSHYAQTLVGGEVHHLTLASLAAGTYVLKVRNADHEQTKLLVRD
jgi:hypothetical protein